MEQTPQKIMHRIMITMPIFFLIGFLIFFLLDKMVGGAILVGAGLGLIVGIIFYFKLKRNDPTGANKSLSYFYIIAGIVLLILALAVFIFERESSKDVIYEVGLGVLFLIFGIYMLKNKQAQKKTWKEIPIGFRILIIFLFISILLNLRDFAAKFQQPNFIFGIIINPPTSMILTIIYLIIPIITIFLIYQKTAWKLLLVLQSFNLINGISSYIKILITPFPELFALLNKPLPNVSPEVLKAAEVQSKLLMSIPMFIGIIIAFIILIYVYKKKEYFSN